MAAQYTAAPSLSAPHIADSKGLITIDAAVFTVRGVPGGHHQMVTASKWRDLAVRYAHRKPEFLAVTHHLAVDAGCGLILLKHALIKGQGDEWSKSLAHRCAGTIRRMASTGGAIQFVLFQAVNQPNRFGGIRGGIIGISHFKPLIYKPM
jgi:hypothetical protein